MTRATMSLTVSSPLDIIVRVDNVTSFRAEDESGGFGILAGHVDTLAVLKSSVIRWKEADADWRYCAVRGGIMTVADGNKINVACRNGVVSSDLASLEKQVVSKREKETDAARRARVSHTKLHAMAIRQIVRYLSNNTGADEESAFDRMFQ